MSTRTFTLEHLEAARIKASKHYAETRADEWDNFIEALLDTEPALKFNDAPPGPRSPEPGEREAALLAAAVIAERERVSGWWQWYYGKPLSSTWDATVAGIAEGAPVPTGGK